MAFVQAVESPEPEAKKPEVPTLAGEQKIEAPAQPTADEESKKKFTKKY
jgi:hypothetical protein